jgi:hypothetical protein
MTATEIEQRPAPPTRLAVDAEETSFEFAATASIHPGDGNG